MNPDDVVLVALVNQPRDWEMVEREHWYRIPTAHAPKQFSGAQYLAFYFGRAFGDGKWQIAHYAPVRGHELVRRRDLIPNEPEHPRAEQLYYKLQLGPSEARIPPIASKRGRRILFLWTTWEKFSAARELNDLFHKGAAHDKLWESLKAAGLDVERELELREGRSRYRVDFLIYCPRGRVAVTIGQAAPKPRRAIRAVALTQEELENHFAPAVEKIKRAIRELGGGYHGAAEGV